MSLKAMVELDNKWVIEHRANLFLILNDILLLIIADKSLQHYLHCVKLPIPEASNQIHLTKTTNCQTFTNFVLL